MPTVIDLGKLVKAKYPSAYKDMSDYDVGVRVKKKYASEYADFADAPSPQVQPSKPKTTSLKKGVAGAVAGNEIGVGESLSAGLVPKLPIVKQAQASADQVDGQAQKLLQAIRANKAAGKDTAKLEATYKLVTSAPAFDFGAINPAANKTNKQALGEVAGVGLDVLAGGSYGKAARALPSLKRGKALETIASKTPLQKAGSFFGKVGTGAGAGYAYDVANNAAQGKENVASPGAGTFVGGALPVVGGAIGLANRFIKSVGKGSAAAFSGSGMDVIDAIASNPAAARKGLRGGAADTLNGLSTQVRGGVSEIAKKAEKEYTQSLESLPKRLGRNPQVLNAGQKTTIKVDGKTYTLSMQGIKSKLTSELRRFGVDVNPGKKEFDFLEAPFVDSEANVLKKVFDVVDQWKDTSPKGLNELAVKVGQFRKAGTQSKELNSVIDAVKRGVRSYLGDRVPAARAMNDRYAQVQDFIEALDQELATNGKFVGGTAEHLDTAKKIANLFNKNKELARELVTKLENGENILGTEAGRELAAGVPRSTASIGSLARSAFEAIVPPRAIGEVVAGVGSAHQKIKPTLKLANKFKPAVKRAITRQSSQSGQ
jgi:hypothetical protein